MYQTPANDDTNAIRIKCTKKPTLPADETSELDLSDMLVHAVEEYVKSRLIKDAGGDGSEHMKEFWTKLEQHEDNLRGSQAIVMAQGTGMIR
jgi:hypothetical protein